jgi:Dolichyl-phosphate-mannose-protein mannosyltransferase
MIRQVEVDRSDAARTVPGRESLTAKARRRERLSTWAPAATLMLLILAGSALRLSVMQETLFGDEHSTRFIVAQADSVPDLVSIIHTDAEITPPLYFLFAWLSAQIWSAPELLRLPSLLAGVALIPLVYLIGLRTIGRRAALTASALTALSPFMIYYSAEARSYGLMITLVALSTFAMLKGTEDRQAPWWVLYAAATCGAVYSHYTAVFVLGAQLLWLLVVHRDAWRPAVLANVCAALLFLPWLSGVRVDFDSPTTAILSTVQPFTAEHIREAITDWALGYPYVVGLRDLPGVPALILLGAGLTVAAVGLTARLARGRLHLKEGSTGLVLVLFLAVATAIGEAVVTLVGNTNLLGARNLNASWPGFALATAAFLWGAGRRAGMVAACLAIAAFAIGAVKMTEPRFGRPQVEEAVRFVERTAGPRRVVVDGTTAGDALVPAGVPNSADYLLEKPRWLFTAGRQTVLYDPFRIVGPAPEPTAVVSKAFRTARGERVAFILLRDPRTRTDPLSRAIVGHVPGGYRRVAQRRYQGIHPTWAIVYGRR